MFKRKGCLLSFLFSITVVAIIFSTMNINDIGLRVLSFYKSLSQENVDLDKLQGKEYAITHEAWNKLLAVNVSEDGQVNYKGFNQSRDSLQHYLELLSNNPPNTIKWSKEEQLAYWINAYNAFTVELILQHYPVNSIKDIGGDIPMVNSPWDIKFFKIGGVDFDLNTIEHEILRKQFNEPRIHFAINCASVSCPILLNKAYTAIDVESQLKQQAIYFVNNPKKNQFKENEVEISGIFNWFEKDFTKNGTLIDFINQYSKRPIRSDTNVKFGVYNWNLNE